MTAFICNKCGEHYNYSHSRRAYRIDGVVYHGDYGDWHADALRRGICALAGIDDHNRSRTQEERDAFNHFANALDMGVYDHQHGYAYVCQPGKFYDDDHIEQPPRQPKVMTQIAKAIMSPIRAAKVWLP